jgi:hypothetical protein
MAGGATAVVVVAAPRGLIGLSAGDREAWSVSRDGIDNLIAGQARRRLGSGSAEPFAFARTSTECWSSPRMGLFKYATPAAIVCAVWPGAGPRGGSTCRLLSSMATVPRRSSVF